MRANIMGWKGDAPEGEAVVAGTVSVVRGRVEWTAGVDALMRDLLKRTGRTRDEGNVLVAALPALLNNPPYRWAEVVPG